MSLAAGTRVGGYEIVSSIGAGGMGEVHRAIDTKLKRQVAIKVLPELLAGDPDRLARFQREAEVLASLNHPHIAAIYGLEDSTDVKALVMELVEGPTLADRIAQGPIALDDALPIAKQIAEALEAAHEQGIIHRDLKPANIKIKADGSVKVLDFGLAKLAEPSAIAGPNSSPLSLSPTITSPALMTGVGVLLGTAAYMSPEQAKGREGGTRSDVWAFGAVLYEMLSGKRAFAGDDVSDTLIAVLRDDPNWSALPADVPARIRRVLQVCLQRNQKQRAQSIGDVRLALEGAFETAAPQQTAASAAIPRWRRVAAAMAGALVIAGAAGAAVWYAMRPAVPLVMRTTISTDGAVALSISGNSRDLAVTPDGSRVVYRGNGQILMRALDQLDPIVLVRAGQPLSLFASPDGHWVGYYDGFALKKVAITSGPPITISTVEGIPRGATWGEDDTIVFATGSLATGLQRVSAAGGAPTGLTRPNSKMGELDHIWPEFLPGGQAVSISTASRSKVPPCRLSHKW